MLSRTYQYSSISGDALCVVYWSSTVQKLFTFSLNLCQEGVEEGTVSIDCFRIDGYFCMSCSCREVIRY